MKMRQGVAVMLLAGVCGLLGGCPAETREGGPVVDPRDQVGPNLHPALRGSVMEMALLASNQPLGVEGYGIVAELPGTGSPEMPPNIRQILVDQLYKLGAGSPTRGTEGMQPERLLETNRVAAVEIRGVIPPMAAKGTHFDLQLTALPGTQTTSLKEGLLWTADLKVIGLERAQTEGETRTIAKGRGPVYCEWNKSVEKPEAAATAPATQKGELAKEGGRGAVNLRRGRVLGGGVVMEDMPISLQLYSPSNAKTYIVQRLINSHFPGRPPHASAMNESVVNLRVPAEYRESPGEFVDLVMHMYPQMDVPGFSARKAEELIAGLRDPKAPHGDLSMALQGLGRTIITDQLRPQYTSENATVRFYTARAGAALNDVQGMVVLQQFAKDARSAYRKDAIRAIAGIAKRGEVISATNSLGELLNDEDNEIRLAAYQGLLEMRSPAVRSYRVRRFDIDIAPSKGPTLIYATQSGRPRIALIGSKLNLAAGVLYISPDNTLTVNVPESDGEADVEAGADIGVPAAAKGGKEREKKEPVLLYYRGAGGEQAVTLKSPTHIAVVLARLGYVPDIHSKDYNPREPFIGASYQEVLTMLEAMCRDHSLEATMVLQPLPPTPPNWTDVAEGARPERAVLSPTTGPATGPATIKEGERK